MKQNIKLHLDTPENYEKHREQYDKEVQLWKEENHTAIISLKVKLFAIGGSRISPQPCDFISIIASHSELIDLPVTLRRMEGNRCHHNVALLWEQRKSRGRLKAIATGYALNEDGMWRPHSWGLTTTHILETTISRLRYFGIPMNAEAADLFAAGFLVETEAEFNAKLEQLEHLRQPSEEQP